MENDRCFVAITPEQMSLFFSSDGVLFPVNISGKITSNGCRRDATVSYKLVMTIYYFNSHLQLESNSAAYSDQLLSIEAYRLAGRSGPTQSDT